MKFLKSLLLLVVSTSALYAQSFEKLSKLQQPEFDVYSSKNFEQPADAIAQRLANAIRYHEQLLDYKPAITLLVLSAADWSTYTSFPVYGMPHYTNEKTLIVAIEDNPFWQSFMPALDQLPKELVDQVRAVYTKEGRLTMQPFFDLLAIHELGHAFHIQGGLTVQRMWMGELFCNIFLHTYVAEKEPESLPALTTFPSMIVSAGAKEYRYTRLQDIEDRYEEIAQQHAKNYGWFQCRWHAGAGKIYDAGGKAVTVKLWNALKEQKEKLSDDALVTLLKQKTHKSLADFIRKWDSETKF